jgi:hypothetical protein
MSAFREDGLTLGQAARRCFSVPDPFAKSSQLGHMRCQFSNVRGFMLCSARSVSKCAVAVLFHFIFLVLRNPAELVLPAYQNPNKSAQDTPEWKLRFMLPLSSRCVERATKHQVALQSPRDVDDDAIDIAARRAFDIPRVAFFGETG